MCFGLPQVNMSGCIKLWSLLGNNPLHMFNVSHSVLWSILNIRRFTTIQNQLNIRRSFACRVLRLKTPLQKPPQLIRIIIQGTEKHKWGEWVIGRIYILKNEILLGMTNWPNSSSFNWFASNVERLSEATEWHGGRLSISWIWFDQVYCIYFTRHWLHTYWHVCDSLVQLQLLLILRRFIGEPKVIIFCWCAGEEESEELLDSRFLLFFISQLLAGVHGWRVVMAGIGIHSLRAILRGKLYVANR